MQGMSVQSPWQGETPGRGEEEGGKGRGIRKEKGESEGGWERGASVSATEEAGGRRSKEGKDWNWEETRHRKGERRGGGRGGGAQTGWLSEYRE